MAAWVDLKVLPARKAEGPIGPDRGAEGPCHHALAALAGRLRTSSDGEMRVGGRAYTVIGVGPSAFTGTVRGLTPSFYAP